MRVGPVRFTNSKKRPHKYKRPKPKADSMEKLIITDEQEFDVEVQFKTQAGNPAKIDGPPTWTAAGPVEILPNPTEPENEFKKLVRRTGDLGTFQVTATGDANLDPEVKRDIILTLDGEVVASEAVSGSIVAGTPRVVV